MKHTALYGSIIIFLMILSFFCGHQLNEVVNQQIAEQFVEPESTVLVIPDMLLEELFKSKPIDCVVLIETNMGLGSGIVISEDGIILTAGHMLEYGLPMKVTFKDGTEWTEFEKVFRDKDADVGLFKIKEVFQFPYLLLGDSNELKVGEDIWAIGMPFGEKWWHCWGKVAKESEKGILYLSMPLNFGNSGCPILNTDNEIVGICIGGIPAANNIAQGHTSNLCAAIIAKYRILFEL